MHSRYPVPNKRNEPTAQIQDNEPSSLLEPTNGLLVLLGYGRHVGVGFGHLVVSGSGADRRSYQFPRAPGAETPAGARLFRHLERFEVSLSTLLVNPSPEHAV